MKSASFTFNGQFNLFSCLGINKSRKIRWASCLNPKGNQPWIFIGRTGAEAETPILWPPDAKSWLTGQDPDAGKDWGQEGKQETEDEMVAWHHWLDGRKISKLQETVKNREAWRAAAHGVQRVTHDLATKQQHVLLGLSIWSDFSLFWLCLQAQLCESCRRSGLQAPPVFPKEQTVSSGRLEPRVFQWPTPAAMGTDGQWVWQVWNIWLKPGRDFSIYVWHTCRGVHMFVLL